MTDEELLAHVLGREVYPSFYELYKESDKISIGDDENKVPTPTDMLQYYTGETVVKYGALTLIIELF